MERSASRLGIILILLIFSLMTGYSQTPDQFKAGWEKVAKLEKEGKTRDALAEVEVILANARASGSYEHAIKALMHKYRMEIVIEEGAELKVFAALQQEIEKATGVERAVLQSILAKALNNYYQNHRYEILDRTVMVENDTAADFQTWDAVKFETTITHLYLQSIGNKEELRKIGVGSLKELIVHSDKSQWRPTLYDVLAHEVIDYLSAGGSDLVEIAQPFVLDDARLFGTADEFVSWNISTPDTSSVLYKSLLVFRELTEWHLRQNNIQPLTALELKRLSFAKQRSVLPNKDDLYVQALRALRDKVAGNPAQAEVNAELATELFHSRPDDETAVKEALELCRETIKKYPETPGAKNCRVLETEILVPRLEALTERVLVPNEPVKLFLRYKNAPVVYARLVSLGRGNDLRQKLQDHISRTGYPNLTGYTVVKSWQIKPSAGDALITHKTEVKMDPLKPGNYFLLLSTNPEFNYKKSPMVSLEVSASNIAFLSQTQADGALNMWVTNRKTGQPLKGATIELFKWEYDYKTRKYTKRPAGKFVTDDNGLAKKPAVKERYENYYAEITHGSDFLSTINNVDQYKVHPYEQGIHKVTHFFTDRSIYRPGQTIYFKGILVEKNGENAKILPGELVTVSLRDVNWEIVDSIRLTSNEYGSFNGTFKAPAGLLTGSMTIWTQTGSRSVQVEEYKRPRFEVKILPVEQSFRIHETVTVKGKAESYSGANIDGAEVKYSIRRVPDFPWWWYSYYWWRPQPVGKEKIIATGTTMTDAEGNFMISFDAAPDLSIDSADKPFFRYEITADVVDITGETHTAMSTVKVGYQSLDANMELPERADRMDMIKINVSTQNLNGGLESAEIQMVISELEQPDRILKERLWEMPDTMSMSRDEHRKWFPNDVYRDELYTASWKTKREVARTSFNTKDKKDWILQPGTIPGSGICRVEFTARSANGDEVKLQRTIIIHSTADIKPPLVTALAVNTNKTTFKPGEILEITVGSSAENARIWLQLAHKGKPVETRIVKVSNSIQRISIPVKEEYLGGLDLLATMIYDNRVYRSLTFIDVPSPGTTLDVSWRTFRDKLLPGQQETWEMHIKGPGSEKVAAELVATMYDASLDAFIPHYFTFGPFGQKRYFRQMGQPNQAISFGISEYTFYYDQKYLEGGERVYPYLNDFGFALSSMRYMRGYGATAVAAEMKVMDAISGNVAGVQANGKAAPPIAREGEVTEEAMSLTDETGENAPRQQPSVRTNLNETAFFFPELRTNENGDIILKFSMPEALTRWNFLGIAHTKDLQTASILKSVVTQKELMVTPNAPRFLREGDKLRFTAKVNNLLETALAGTATLVFKDAFTGKQIDLLQEGANEAVPFNVAKGQSALVTWNIAVPKGIEAVNYEVVATAGNFSDGEGAMLPVLTNRMLVTETMPVYVNGGQKKNFTFTRLKESKSNTLEHHKLTFELTSNPAWYAVQALPYLMEYPYECSEQIFSRYYANALAAHIANSSPRIRQVFESWKSSGELISQLDKNEELKSLVLEETPWVREAKSETEQRQRIAMLFDLHKLAKEQSSTFDKLIKLQTPNGGFAWFKGMRDNWYITQHIVAGFGHLQQLGVIDIDKDKDLRRMLERAVKYIDDRIAENLLDTKKYDKDYLKNDHLGYIEAHYLYARSFFPKIAIDKGSKEAADYYRQQATQYWLSKTLYQQGMLALALKRQGDAAISVKIVESLRQNAVFTDEMGMYWKALQRGGWYWYQAPIETQALLIEAFNEISNKGDEVDRMRQWLLKQKQTQSWPTTKATAEACYALLLSGRDWLADDAPVQFWLGGNKIDPQAKGGTVESGTGYYKISWDGSEIKPQMANAQLQKTSKGPAWGAMYWQYFEELDKIGKQETGLQVVKRVFKEEKTDAGPRLMPITGETPLNPGDILKVRIELRTDRDLEFVHMKDMRASGLEPVNVLSEYKYNNGLGYYEATRDAATNFFFDWLPKGTYVFEYPLRVNLAGDFSNGLTTIQSMYAPEFTSHTEGIRLKIEERR